MGHRSGYHACDMLKTAGSGQISVWFQLRLSNSKHTIWSQLPTMTGLLRNICVSCFVYRGWPERTVDSHTGGERGMLEAGFAIQEGM